MRVRHTDNPSALSHLKSCWNPLLQQSSSNSPFLTHEFLSLWWKHFGNLVKLCLVVAYNKQGETIGIAPMAIQQGRGLRRLTFLGGIGPAHAEAQDFIIRSGQEAEVGHALASYIANELASEWDLIDFSFQKPKSIALRKFQDSPAVNRAIAQTRVQTITSRYAPLPAYWDDYYASRPIISRRSYQSKLNSLVHRHKVDQLTAPRDLEVRQALQWLHQLQETPDPKLKASEPPTAPLQKFHQDLAWSFSDKNWLDLRILQADELPIAARMDFRYGGKMWSYQQASHPDFQRYTPIQLLLGQQLEDAISHGLHEYDFLSQQETHRETWADKTRLLTRIICANRRSPSARVLETMKSLQGK